MVPGEFMYLTFRQEWQLRFSWLVYSSTMTERFVCLAFGSEKFKQAREISAYEMADYAWHIPDLIRRRNVKLKIILS